MPTYTAMQSTPQDRFVVGPQAGILVGDKAFEMFLVVPASIYMLECHGMIAQAAGPLCMKLCKCI